jgi:hypothetical protein
VSTPFAELVLKIWELEPKEREQSLPRAKQKKRTAKSRRTLEIKASTHRDADRLASCCTISFAIIECSHEG